MTETEKDLKGREVELGRIPMAGTKLVILGNEFRVIFSRENPIRLTLELTKHYEPK